MEEILHLLQETRKLEEALHAAFYTFYLQALTKLQRITEINVVVLKQIYNI